MTRTLPAAVSAAFMLAAGCAFSGDGESAQERQVPRDVWATWEAIDPGTERLTARQYEEGQDAYYDLLRRIEPTVTRGRKPPRDARFVETLDRVNRNIQNQE